MAAFTSESEVRASRDSQTTRRVRSSWWPSPLLSDCSINATVLGMMDAMLPRPFPFRNHEAPRRPVGEAAERLRHANDGAHELSWTGRSQGRTIKQLTASAWLDATLAGTGDPERVQGFRVSAGFFSSRRRAGARPHVHSRRRAARRPSARCAWRRIWRRRFGGMPPSCTTSSSTALHIRWWASRLRDSRFRWARSCRSRSRSRRRRLPIAKSGRWPWEAGSRTVIVDATRSEMDAIARPLRGYPGTNRERGVLVRPFSPHFVRAARCHSSASCRPRPGSCCCVLRQRHRPPARARDRPASRAVRAAAHSRGRSRIVRRLVTETVVLGLLAALVAIPLASTALDASDERPRRDRAVRRGMGQPRTGSPSGAGDPDSCDRRRLAGRLDPGDGRYPDRPH